MEREEKKNELLNFIREYRFVREEELMFHIRASMEEVPSTCQKVELSELPLSVKERHRLLDYTNSFLPLWMRVLQCTIEVSMMVGGFLLMTHLMKQR